MHADDYNKVVAWLGRSLELEHRIRARDEQAARLRQSLMPRAVGVSGMPGGGRSDWTERMAAALDIEQDIADEVRRLRQARAEIVSAIDAVPDADQRTVLEMRYLCGYRVGRIAARLHYDRTWVWRLHNRGVAAVASAIARR